MILFLFHYSNLPKVRVKHENHICQDYSGIIKMIQKCLQLFIK